MNAKEQFTQRLIAAMEFAKLNPNQLAERMSADGERVYSSVTNKWRDGAMPSGEYLLRLPGALGVDGHWLLTGDGSMQRTPPTEAQELLERFVSQIPPHMWTPVPRTEE